jgi:hypothetical protein
MDTSSEDGTIKRRPRFRKLKVWKYFCDYFPIRLHKSVDLDPERTYVFGKQQGPALILIPFPFPCVDEGRIPPAWFYLNGGIWEYWD